MFGRMDSRPGVALLLAFRRSDIFLAGFDGIPVPRADNAHHDLCEPLVVGFVAALSGATAQCAAGDYPGRRPILGVVKKLSCATSLN